MGWGTIPDDHPLMAGMVGLQTSHRYGNATMLASRFRARHRQPLGQPAYRLGRASTPRAASSSTSTSSRRRSAACSCPTTASCRTPGRRCELFVEVAREWKAAGKLQGPLGLGRRMPGAQGARCMRKTNFDNVPIKPQRVYQGMNNAFGAGHLLRQRRSACRRSPARSSSTSTSRATGSTAARPARSAGRCRRRSASAPPTRTRQIVALSGDYDFQFLIEELAVGAQFKLPYIHIVVNNSYLGLIRQSQRGFEMDYLRAARLRQHQRAGASSGYGVDHVAVAEGLGCKAIRVTDPDEIAGRRSPRPRADGRVPGAGRDRDHPGAGHQHRHGHRDRQHHGVRGNRSTPGAAPSACWSDRMYRRRRETHHAEVRGQSDDAVHRDTISSTGSSGPPRPASRRVEFLFPYPYKVEDLVQRLQANDLTGAAQPARRRLGCGRARHRLHAGPCRRIPRRRRQGDRVRDGAEVPAGQLPRRHGAGRGGSDQASRHLRRQHQVSPPTS